MCCLFLQTLPRLEQAAAQPPLPGSLRRGRRRPGILLKGERSGACGKGHQRRGAHGRLHLPLRVLRLQELKRQYEDAGWKQKVVEFQTMLSPAAPRGIGSRKMSSHKCKGKPFWGLWNSLISLSSSDQVYLLGVFSLAWPPGISAPSQPSFVGSRRALGQGGTSSTLQNRRKVPSVYSGADDVLNIVKAGGKYFSKTSLYSLLPWLHSLARTLLHATDLLHPVVSFNFSPSFPSPYPGW